MTDTMVQTYESMEAAGAADLEEYDKILLASTRQLPVQDEDFEDEEKETNGEEGDSER